MLQSDPEMAKPTDKLSELVRISIENDPATHEVLEKGLVNVRALARQIQVGSKTPASIDAIVSAIRRYPTEKISAAKHSVGELISKLSLRDQITAFGVSNSREVWRVISRLPDEIEVSKGDVFRVVSGVEATTVILDSKNAPRLKSDLPAGSISRIFEDMAEITIHLKEPSWDTRGVLSVLGTQMSVSGVNILFNFGYGPPPCVVFEVAGDDAAKAFQAFERLKRPSARTLR